MTRVSESTASRGLLANVARNRTEVNRISNEISSGIKAAEPGDSPYAGTIEQFKESLQRIEGYQNTIKSVKASLEFQDNVLSESNELLVRAKELAVQGANETLTSSQRAQVAEEVFQIRDHLVSLANSTYQGRYIFGGADDDDPPYDAATYTNPSTGAVSQRYVFDAEDGTSTTRSVNVTDSLSVTVNTPGDQIYDNAIQAMERLGRALSGYRTDPDPGTPDGSGTAFTFPQDYQEQTADIKSAMDLLDTARSSDLGPEITSVAGRLKRLDTAESLLNVGQLSGSEVLSRLQSTDVASAATQLSLAQTSLEAALTVSLRVLNQTILDYL